MPWTPDIKEDDPSERILATASTVPKDAVGEGGYTVQVNANRQSRGVIQFKSMQTVNQDVKNTKPEENKSS